MKTSDFTLDDFRKQFEQLARMGNMRAIIGSMPSMSEVVPEGEDPEKLMTRIRGMIDSMTLEERRNPDVIDSNRRRRIAAGSGTDLSEIQQLLLQFDQVRTLMQQMARMSMWERLKTVTGLGVTGPMSVERGSEFTLEDFRESFGSLAKSGGVTAILRGIPGTYALFVQHKDPKKVIGRTQGMIDSMTTVERRDPDSIDSQRRCRIAAGSGTDPHEVKLFLAHFKHIRDLMRGK